MSSGCLLDKLVNLVFFFSDDVCWRHCLQEDKQTHVNVYALYNKHESSKYLSLY